ncbi:MAG: hypothetical protein AAGI46_06565 [Planctomycetota bacterium]
MAISVDPVKLDYLAQRPTADRRDLPEIQRETLLRRAEHLERFDHALVVISLRRKLTVREMGKLLGRNAGVIARRLISLRRRLTDPDVISLIHGGERLDPVDRDIGISVLLRKERIDVIAYRHRLSPAIVRRRMQFVRGWIKGQRDGAILARQAMAKQM